MSTGLHSRGESDPLPVRIDLIGGILDRVHPPVARFRIISNGLAQNHTLQVSEDISGTKACLSCGNCVDACPVVASKPEDAMFVRTSMLLENVVGEECRRCHKCVAACPQINRPIKDFVRGFRRIERLSHWDLLASYLVLTITGILINHWGEGLPADLRTAFGVLHRIFTVSLVAAPIIFLIFDRHHFAMAARRALISWSRQDSSWFKGAWRWVISFGKAGQLNRGAFNPAQRMWYIYIPTAMVFFAITGILKWLGPNVVGQATVDVATTIHVVVAWTTDILVALHVYLKLVWPALRDFARGTRQYFALQRRQRGIEPFRLR